MTFWKKPERGEYVSPLILSIDRLSKRGPKIGRKHTFTYTADHKTDMDVVEEGLWGVGALTSLFCPTVDQLMYFAQIIEENYDKIVEEWSIEDGHYPKPKNK